MPDGKQDTEAMVCMMSVKCAAMLGANQIILEVGASKLVKVIKDVIYDRDISAIVKDIRYMLVPEFSSVSVASVPRSCNRLEDYILRFGSCLLRKSRLLGLIIFLSMYCISLQRSGWNKLLMDRLL
jgi:hypothetical protein